jgi:hypothetical protein
LYSFIGRNLSQTLGKIAWCFSSLVHHGLEWDMIRNIKSKCASKNKAAIIRERRILFVMEVNGCQRSRRNGVIARAAAVFYAGLVLRQIEYIIQMINSGISSGRRKGNATAARMRATGARQAKTIRPTPAKIRAKSIATKSRTNTLMTKPITPAIASIGPSIGQPFI